MSENQIQELLEHLEMRENEHQEEIQKGNLAALGPLEQQIQDLRWQINKARSFYRFGI